MKRICVFCGSSDGARAIYKQNCDLLAEAMVSRQIDLVYGGASIGLMGAIADAVLSRGGKVIGVIPEHLQNYEISHSGLTELLVVPDMHQRKAKMAELSDGFIALPGNIDHYYDSLIDFLSHSVQEKFLKAQHLDNMLRSADANALLERMIYFSKHPDEFLQEKIQIDQQPA